MLMILAAGRWPQKKKIDRRNNFVLPYVVILVFKRSFLPMGGVVAYKGGGGVMSTTRGSYSAKDTYPSIQNSQKDGTRIRRLYFNNKVITAREMCPAWKSRDTRGLQTTSRQDNKQSGSWHHVHKRTSFHIATINFRFSAPL